MAFSYEEKTGDGSQHTYTFNFDYILKAHVKLFYTRDILLDTQAATLTLGTDYNFTADKSIQLIGSTLNSGTTAGQPYNLPNGTKLMIERQTPDSAQISAWQDGSNLTAEALNNADLQNLYVTQETQDRQALAASKANAAKLESETATSNVATLTANPIFSGNFGSTAISLNDDTKIGFGNTAASPDATIDWDTDGWFDRLEIRSTRSTWSYVPTGESHLFLVDGALVLGVRETYIEAYKDIKPNADGTVDLGASDKEWKDLYVDGTGYIDTVSADDITGAAIVTSGTSTSDTKVYSAKRCDELFYNLASAEEIQSGEAWVAADNKVATTAAIDARIVDLVDDVGGFVPLANELSFPDTNPDINNSGGTLLSVPLTNNYTSNSEGSIVITNGSVNNQTVTILLAEADTIYKQGFGIIVETTSNTYIYKFHRYVPKATEVTQVATNIANIQAVVNNQTNINSAVSNATNITTVANNISDVNTVAANNSNINAVAGDAADIGACATNIGSIAAIGSDLANNFENITDYGSITGAVTSTSGTSDISTLASGSNLTNIATVAGKETEIGRLGTADAVADMAILGTTDIVADLETCADDITAIQGASANATTASTKASEASASAANAATSATSAASSASTATTQASTATTQATNAAASASTANTHQLSAKQYRDDASGIKTQAESNVYNLSDSVSSHTAWGDVTDVGPTHFASESGNVLLTMSKGSSVYDYGSVA